MANINNLIAKHKARQERNKTILYSILGIGAFFLLAFGEATL